jgi:hypothetical protein
MTNEITFTECLARVRAFIQAHTASRQRLIPPPDANSEAEFHRLALALFALQYQHNPVLRRLCDSRGVKPGLVTDWRRIPAVPTSAFKELEVTTLPPGERTTVFRSSGTTGQQPGRHFHNAESLALYETSLLPWFRAHLLADSSWSRQQAPERELSLLCLTPPPALAPHSSLAQMMETVRRELVWARSAFVGVTESDGAWRLYLPRLVSILDAAGRANSAVVLLGTAFSFVHLLDHLAANRLGWRLPAGSRVMETGGYKGRSRMVPKSGLHALITRYLGIPESHIVCEYGMSELSSQAYDRRIENPTESGGEPRRSFRFPPWARGQIISPETGAEAVEGETGLIRVLDLANVRSVLAVQTEDLGVRRGDGFELLGRAAVAEPRGCSLMSLEDPHPGTVTAALARHD